MDCTVRKKDHRLERAKSKNWSSSTWRKKSSSTAFISLAATTAPALFFHDAKTGKIILRTLSTALAPRLTMLRHQAAENSVITSGAAKKVLFSSRDNCNCLILKQFERTSYFLGIQAWVLRQNGKQKKYAQKSGQRSTFSFLISLFFHHKPKRMLKFLRNGFWIVIVQKKRKKGLSHSGKMHFSVSGHVTLGVVRWRHELDYICPLWVLSKFGPIEAYMCRVIASWFFPSNGIKRYLNGPLSETRLHLEGHMVL